MLRCALGIIVNISYSNHYRNIFFTLNVQNNDNDLIVANGIIIVQSKDSD